MTKTEKLNFFDEAVKLKDHVGSFLNYDLNEPQKELIQRTLINGAISLNQNKDNCITMIRVQEIIADFLAHLKRIQEKEGRPRTTEDLKEETATIIRQQIIGFYNKIFEENK